MPKKSKKSKGFGGAKVSENENENAKFLSQSENTLEKKETIASDGTTSEKQEKQGCLLSLDKKLKLQLKKQKKKEKKLEFEASKCKNIKKVDPVGETQEECETQIFQDAKISNATVPDNSLQVKEVEIPISSMVVASNIENCEIESNKTEICEFVKPVEESEYKVEEKKIIITNTDFEAIENKPSIEIIPEDLYEDFIENEEIVQTKEAIKTFPRTSPLSSPKCRKKDISLTEIVVSSPPRVFYDYHGVSYRECVSKPIILEDIQDGIVVLHNYKTKEEELFSNRKLDVIVEESSEFSDTSGNSEKRNQGPKPKNEILEGDKKENNTAVNQPLLRKTVKIFSLNGENKNNKKMNNTLSGNTYIVRPEIVETVKMSNDVVKIELAESESEGDFEINQSETSDGASEIEVICLDSSDAFSAKIKDNLKQVDEVMDCSDVSSWSIKSISSNFNGQIEEGSESWRSSLNPETGNSAEADVESDLDSQKACIFEEFFDEINLKKSDVLKGKINNETEFFLTEHKNISGMDSSKTEPSFSFNKLYKSNDGGKPKEQDLKENKKKEKDDEISGFVEEEPETKNLLHDKDKYPKVSVKNMAEAIKEDMDRILMSKIKCMQNCNKNDFSESFSGNLLEEAKNEAGKKKINRNNSENSLKVKESSSSSSYENVIKSKKNVTVSETSLKNLQNPDPLVNLAEKKVLSLPYGKLILKKIGLGSCCSKDCSKNSEEDMYLKTNSQPNEAPGSVSLMPSQISIHSLRGSVSGRSRDHDGDEQILESDKSYVEFDYSNPKLGEIEKWYGSKTDVPTLFLGFSPSQKKIYEETSKKFMPDEAEAASLLDLHQKFLERRGYNESFLHGKDRNLIFNSKGKDIHQKPVVITEITVPYNGLSEYLKKPSPDGAEVKEKNKMKEMRITKEDATSQFEFSSTNQLENKKLEIFNDLIKQKNHGEGSQKNENRDDEESKEKTEAEGNGQESEVVGNSCLLAILQNAISDEFVPELKTDSSIKCSSESHEVSLLKNYQTMDEAWQSNKIYESSTKKIQEKEKNDVLNEDRQTFEQIWNKEKGITMGERKINDVNLENGKIRKIFRPKTICLGKDDNTNETETEKKNISKNKLKTEENEKLVITENLPAVSDVIRSFEKNSIEEFQNPTNGEINRKIQIHMDNEKYQISKKRDIALISNGDLEKRKVQIEKRKSLPISILTDEEVFKQKMYNEYMSKLAERIERRQQKAIRVSQSNEIECPEEIRFFDLENEFINKVKERREKMSLAHDKKEKEQSQKAFMESLQKQCQEFSDYWKEEISHLENGKKEENDFDKSKDGGTESSATSKRSSVQLIFDTSSNVDSLPKHLQEFLMVDEEEFPDFYDDLQRVKAKVQECRRCKLRKNNLLREIDEELVLSKGFLFGRGKLYDNMPSSVVFSPNFKATAPRPGVWSPAQGVQIHKTEIKKENEERKRLEDEPIPPVWTPKASPILEKKEFRPVNFESPTLPRKKYIQDDKRESSVPPPWQQPGGDKLPELAKSPSSPALILPRAPNPTVTLLQKAREGHLPRGAHYLNSDMNESPPSDGTSIERLEIVSTIKSDRPRKIEIAPKKIIGIGPTTKEGVPLVLRSEVTEENKEKWYKRMYDSLHKAGQDDDYVTVKYRTSPSRKGIYSYQQSSRSGYQSEPESITYDLSSNKYVSLDRRRAEKSKEDNYECITLPRSRSSPPRRDFPGYKNQPGRIEDYEPGRSSISETEANKWWDEVLEIFDEWLEYNPEAPESSYNKLVDAIKLRREEGKNITVQKSSVSPRSFTNFASGHISDPQYVYKRTEEEIQSPNSEEQKEAYRIIQKGGEIPLKGLRKPAPTRPKDNLETEIEYFPLSPTLTRIRVHKQNITPLSDYPLYKSPPAWHTALNYPTAIPFGVCSSFSQVQIFPPPFTQFLTGAKEQEPVSVENKQSELDSSKKPQKFSVQLQNISGPDSYVQIIPKPRCRTKKSPIYANLVVQEDLSDNSDTKRGKSPVTEKASRYLEKESTELNRKKNQNTSSFAPEKKVGFATFSDFKRIAPSLISTSTSKVSLSKILNKSDQRKSDDVTEKKGSLISHLTSKPSSQNKRTKLKGDNKENKENIIKNKDQIDKIKKREKKKSLLSKPKSSKIVKAVKGSKKVPLSESTQREKPLSKTGKSFKTFSNTLKQKKDASKNFFTQVHEKVESDDKSLEIDRKKDIIGYISRFVESEAGETYVDLKSPEDLKPQVCFDVIEEEEEEEDEEKEEEDVTMSPIYESLDESSKAKQTGDIDVTEVFRSRSFSPDVRRKIYKLPDMNKPVPPKRKQSKNSPTLKMWSKMMVSYPGRKSRSDEYHSNVKFLQEKIEKKLKDNKDLKPEFGDDIETVRTVKRNKNGSMSIKTDRFVRLPIPHTSGTLKTRSTYPDIERRKKLFEPKTQFRSLNTLDARKYSDASTITKSSDPENSKKQKGSNTYLKSSTIYSVRNSRSEEEDKRKSLKVTVAISSKGKELAKKSSGVTTPKKELVLSKTSSSPCPSVTSSKSARSGKSPSSDRGSLSPKSPQTRFFSPNSSLSRLSSPSRSASSGSTTYKQKPRSKFDEKNTKETPKSTLKSKEIIKTPLVQKSSTKKLSGSNGAKSGTAKNGLKKKSKKNDDSLSLENNKALKKIDNINVKSVVQKTSQELTKKVEKEKNEIVRGRDLVRTDSFFQNLFLRGPVDRKPVIEVERLTSVLERARRYQRRIDWPETYKSEPSLSLRTFYLNQKRPVSLSRFRHLERDLSSSRSHSPLGSWHSENFQMKLKRFDSMSQFGDGLCRDYSPEGKERSSSEPPLHRSEINSPENGFEGKFRMSNSEASSMRSSPNSSRSPSSRRIRSCKTSFKSESSRALTKNAARARSAGEIEDLKSKPNLYCGNLGKSSSSLSLSNLSDHTEYQAYVLELMHSTRKCERFRELHKFYSNLERIEKLEKTASIGDLRPRLRNEEIIDFDRWKKIRTKERAEAELKTLVDNLVKVQKEKDLLFRAADIETVRWKGDRGLRIKERSVEDLKEQFDKFSQEELEFKKWKNDLELRKDNYKSLWKGSSIADVAGNLNSQVISHRGRPITVEEFQKIEAANAKIGNEYGYSLKAWKNLSNEQINLLKKQLSEIYTRDSREKASYESLAESPYKYEILVPEDNEIKSSGESSLQVRCSSAMSKSQTFTPTIKRKENLRKELKKSDSLNILSPITAESSQKVSVHPLPWKEEVSTTKFSRSHSESRSVRGDHIIEPRSKSVPSKPLTENEKKHLSMTLSREVIEKMTKSSGQGPLFPRETLGALAVAGSDLRELPKSSNRGGHDFSLNLQQQKKDLETFPSEKCGKVEAVKFAKLAKIIPAPSAELESGSGSSDTSIKTVIRRDSVDVLKRVQYFEELQQAVDEHSEPDLKENVRNEKQVSHESRVYKENTESGFKLEKPQKSKMGGRKTNFVPSSSLENLNDYFGQQKQYATSSLQSKQPYKKLPSETSRNFIPLSPREEDYCDSRNYFEDRKWIPHHSISPLGLRGSSNDSLFSYRSRSVSPDPTKYYRAYLRMVKCGAVRKLCNKFESWEDILSLSSDRDFWLPPAPRRFASDPELTRDLLKRFGTDPTKVTVRGQEVGDVRWLRTKFEKDMSNTRGRSRFRRARSPLLKSPITVSDRYMPRINIISKKAELQLQGLNQNKVKDMMIPSNLHDLAASPEGYKTLIDYTKDHGGYYYTGEVEKLRRKFEKLHEAERLSILGQMYTSTPDVNELRDIAPYLECSWVAHRYPRAFGSPQYQTRLREPTRKVKPKPRPHSSSPIRTKQLSSILKQPHPPTDRTIFADQKYDPSIHRPKYRYQPEHEVERRSKRGDPDWCRHWNKPTVTFKDSPRKYVESEVTIHYKSPVRSEAKAMLSEDELARRQAESMKRIYKEERRRKYLQELQDMNSRRHTDNFTPSQKSPIPLNRYDDFPFNDSGLYTSKSRDYPILVARGLYDFVGRRPRELAFRRGDIIFIIRRLDKNWCEGELNGAVGLFPLSYVEVIPYNEINMKFGRARAKYDFVPQTSLELAAHKGDMITLIRKIDENWFEGRIRDKTGIIPTSYCHILAMPQASRIPIRNEKVNKPVATPAAHSLIHNGSGLSSKHYYAPYLSGPNSPGRSTISSASANYHDGHVSADMLIDEALMQLDEEFDLKRSTAHSTSQPLNVRINPRPEPALYQVMFNHVPNNDDELELVQGETVSVVEKCGDGWYIGSKTSDGKLGIFPGTHVRRIAPEFV